MTRSWIGFFLLLILFATGLLCTWVMGSVHDPMAQKLEQAAQEALDRDWIAAAWHTAEAQNQWNRWQLFRAALTDHSPAEEIDALFAMLQVYGTQRERVAYAALCREMAQKIRAIGEAHALVSENLL